MSILGESTETERGLVVAGGCGEEGTGVTAAGRDFLFVVMKMFWNLIVMIVSMLHIPNSIEFYTRAG